MKDRAQITLIIVSVFLLNAILIAQTKEWNIEITGDDSITVKSRIAERIDEKGDEMQLIEYTATTTASVSLHNCISVLKEVSNHKEFTDDEVSQKVETLSDHEWVVYYYTNPPWPVPDNDCVARMSLSEEESQRTAIFTLSAAPSMYEMKDVRRMTYYEVTYEFKDLGKGKIEMTVASKSSPTVQFPAWMISAWFPEGPADILRTIIRLANSIQ